MFACLLASLNDCLAGWLLACLLACLLARLLVRLLVRMLKCLNVCLLLYLHAGMPECLLASGSFECVFA